MLKNDLKTIQPVAALFACTESELIHAAFLLMWMNQNNQGNTEATSCYLVNIVEIFFPDYSYMFVVYCKIPGTTYSL